MKNTELKPCPFCGNEQMESIGDNVYGWKIYCGLCKLEIRDWPWLNKGEEIDRGRFHNKWNQRSNESLTYPSSVSNLAVCKVACRPYTWLDVLLSKVQGR